MKRLSLLLITLMFLSCSNDDNEILQPKGELLYNQESFALNYAYKIEFDFTVDNIRGFEIILTDQPITFENNQLNLLIETEVLLRMVFFLMRVNPNHLKTYTHLTKITLTQMMSRQYFLVQTYFSSKLKTMN